jgi:hypothetical protein
MDHVYICKLWYKKTAIRNLFFSSTVTYNHEQNTKFKSSYLKANVQKRLRGLYFWNLFQLFRESSLIGPASRSIIYNISFLSLYLDISRSYLKNHFYRTCSQKSRILKLTIKPKIQVQAPRGSDLSL